MPNLVGPSHHIFFAALHRRRLWLEHLSEAYVDFANANWLKKRNDLDRAHRRTLSILGLEEHLGIQYPLSLQLVLDDTPIESFLTTLAENLDSYETQLLSLMEELTVHPLWAEALDQTSMLWGREIAQECLMSPLMTPWTSPNDAVMPNLFELFHSVLQGGDFLWKPLLLRRSTRDELQYELRHCPHQKHKGGGANLACRFEAKVYQGFIQALLPTVHYERRLHKAQKSSYCVDQLHLSANNLSSG